MKLHTVALVTGAFWLGSLIAVTSEPHQSVAHLAAYAWFIFVALSVVFGVVVVLLMAEAAERADRAIFEEPWDYSQIRWFKDEK